jgi:hypothetical protein
LHIECYLLPCLESSEQLPQGFSTNFGRILGYSSSHFTSFYAIHSFGIAIGSNNKNLSKFASILNSLHGAEGHRIIARIDSFEVRESANNIGCYVECFCSVPISWLAGDKSESLNSSKCLSCTLFAEFTRSISGFSFKNSNFSACAANLLHYVLACSAADYYIISGNKSENIAACCFQSCHIYFFVNVYKNYTLFVGLCSRLNQIYRRNRGKSDCIVILAEKILEKLELTLCIILRLHCKDINLDSLLLGFRKDSFLHGNPEGVSQGFEYDGYLRSYLCCCLRNNTHSESETYNEYDCFPFHIYLHLCNQSATADYSLIHKVECLLPTRNHLLYIFI